MKQQSHSLLKHLELHVRESLTNSDVAVVASQGRIYITEILEQVNVWQQKEKSPTYKQNDCVLEK